MAMDRIFDEPPDPGQPPCKSEKFVPDFRPDFWPHFRLDFCPDFRPAVHTRSTHSRMCPNSRPISTLPPCPNSPEFPPEYRQSTSPMRAHKFRPEFRQMVNKVGMHHGPGDPGSPHIFTHLSGLYTHTSHIKLQLQHTSAHIRHTQTSTSTYVTTHTSHTNFNFNIRHHTCIRH